MTNYYSSLIGPIFAMMYNVKKHILAVSVIINIRELISFQWLRLLQTFQIFFFMWLKVCLQSMYIWYFTYLLDHMSTNMVEITEVYISEGGRFYTQPLTLFIYFITYKTNFNTHFLISFIISDRFKKKKTSQKSVILL